MANLQTVALELFRRSDLQETEIDVSAVSGTIDGMLVSNLSTVRASLEPIAQAFALEVFEVGGKITVKPRTSPDFVVVDWDDLIEASPGVSPLDFTRRQTEELPRQLHGIYIQRDGDFEQGAQRAIRTALQNTQPMQIEWPIVMTDDAAREAVERELRRMWTEVVRVTFAVSLRAGAGLKPSDVIQITRDGAIIHEVRVVQVRQGGLVVGVEGFVTDVTVHEQGGVTGAPSPTATQTPADIADTAYELLDIPAVRAGDLYDAGFYVALAPSTTGRWRAGTVYRSADDADYRLLAASSLPATMGTTDTALGNGPWLGFDRGSSVEVTMINGDLLATDDDGLAALGNTAVIGSEIVQFRDVELIAAGRYRLSHFVRGLAGTEHQIDQHAAGERFVLLQDGVMQRIDDGPSLIGVSRYYKVATSGTSLSGATAATFTNTAVSRKPYAPVHVRASRSGGDWLFTWERRARAYLARLQDGLEGPLNEEAESYQVTIYDGATAARVIGATGRTATYTAAEQNTDFGGVQSSLSIDVRQISAVAGAGFAQSLTV